MRLATAIALSARLLLAAPRPVPPAYVQPWGWVPAYPGWLSRSIRRMRGETTIGRPWRPGAALAAILALPGCAITPDTLCQTSRPAAALNDTADTRTRQATAAKLWDSRCTVRGWVTR
jgi:hypothetical protein